MGRPLLDLDQEWHRQRTQLRANHLRPPPLVTAGLDLVHDVSTQSHQRVQVAGLALIFGLFPATFAEFAELARNNLRLGNEAKRGELSGVLNTRIQALWAWLPTLQQDCYLELDHATDAVRAWLIGPGAGESRELVSDDERSELDQAFLDALVITSSRHWGGREGLERLSERFGRQPLLAAAQVAEAMERQAQDPKAALAIAKASWPALSGEDETTWEPLVEQEDPWVCVQLGRLALRLGLARAARLLLGQADRSEVSPVAHFDLGQACEAISDLVGAEAAFARYVAAQGDDPDGWRRLLFCRLRLGLAAQAEEPLKRYRAAGGNDQELVERLLLTIKRVPLPLLHRAHLAGWLGPRLSEAMARQLPLPALIGEIVSLRFIAAAQEGDAGSAEVPGTRGAGGRTLVRRVEHLRAALRVLAQVEDGELTSAQAAETPTSTVSPSRGQAQPDALVRTALLALPFLGRNPETPSVSQAAAHALLALKLHSESAYAAAGYDSSAVRAALLELAHLAQDG